MYKVLSHFKGMGSKLNRYKALTLTDKGDHFDDFRFLLF